MIQYTLTEICGEIRNYFDREDDRRVGSFAIVNGHLASCDFLQEGQMFRVVGSVFNDGVWQYPADDMDDEEFDGAVWPMCVPPAVLKLAQDVDAWKTDYEKAASSPYQSESFGGYSYTVKSGNGANGGSVSGWRGVFADRLNKWRKIWV